MTEPTDIPAVFRRVVRVQIEQHQAATTYAVMEESELGLHYECQGVNREHAWRIAREKQIRAEMANIPVVFKVFALVEMPDGEL